jgi:hypothetical protein
MELKNQKRQKADKEKTSVKQNPTLSHGLCKPRTARIPVSPEHPTVSQATQTSNHNLLRLPET